MSVFVRLRQTFAGWAAIRPLTTLRSPRARFLVHNTAAFVPRCLKRLDRLQRREMPQRMPRARAVMPAFTTVDVRRKQ